ncbi:phage terminase large subunit-like protein [Hephaestia caeni]|uniref:Phage terminase large subunit-like protein n=1 Tax=Hephaestia caeni TaxID=645617 RepID=A0A397NN80_9SPHN|nr:terminase family protein [Hephaestia caeni]RIA37858.1 phage terminase large subunit-like protein [Hephaestia caeni]
MADEARGDPVRRLAALPPPWRDRALADLTLEQQRELAARWRAWAHPGQIAPEGDWRVWLIRAGRGFGKTRAGAEWVTGFARANKKARIALVGATAEDVRSVMIEGPSGLIAVAADDEPVTWRTSAHELRFASGARAFVYSAAAPEKLRGPEHHLAWCDELAKWRYGDAAWDNLMLGMRLGDAPRVLVTTTPRPVPLLRRIMADRATVETLGRTQDNPHLPASFVAAMEETYGGTRLGRQELGGELIDDVVGALWTRDLIERCRVAATPELVRVVVGVDPPAGIGGDACGIVALGLGRDGHGYVIEDASVAGASPEGWAQAVAACAARRRADRVIAEANQGGSMVMSVLTAADAGLPVRLVHASRGKAARAEPIATLYEAGKMHHADAFTALEDELCGLIAGGGYEGPGRSPDRADALVWAASELMLGRRGAASVRGL